MAYDGHLKFDTSVDGKGFQQGISTLAKGAAAALTAVSAALGAMAGYAVKVGSDFEAGMSEVAAISGATGDELDALTAKAKEMGASTKFSATESAEALKYMAMAGWDTQSMLDGLPGIMNLAAASGEELGAVSDIVTDALTAFADRRIGQSDNRNKILLTASGGVDLHFKRQRLNSGQRRRIGLGEHRAASAYARLPSRKYIAAAAPA